MVIVDPEVRTDVAAPACAGIARAATDMSPTRARRAMKKLPKFIRSRPLPLKKGRVDPVGP
jgi:hypothetical protein